jgi:hypothetical protein
LQERTERGARHGSLIVGVYRGGVSG